MGRSHGVDPVAKHQDEVVVPSSEDELASRPSWQDSLMISGALELRRHLGCKDWDLEN